LRKAKIKMEFAIKTPEELDQLSHEELLRYIKELQKNIVQEKPKKDSSNSSIAPSHDMGRGKKKKNQSLREKSGQKPGGQPGREGRTLRQSDTPDTIIPLLFEQTHCPQCGASLEEVPADLKEKRQVLDLSLKKIQAQITEYQRHAKTCTVCGHTTYSTDFPSGITPNIRYGEHIEALVAYLSISGYISYNRIARMVSSLFGVALSEGAVDAILKRTAAASAPEIERIKARLEGSGLVGIDETGCRVHGNRHWHWVFQNEQDTLIVANKSRGAKVINETFEEGFVHACVVHDNYSAYSKLLAQREQLCLSHKLRDITYAIETDNTEVMKQIKTLIQEAIHDHKETMSLPQRAALKRTYETMLDDLLAASTIPGSETHKQIQSLTKAHKKDQLFTFLLHPDIPPDNNGSERAIRNIKVKMKVSGQFKTQQGAEDYAALRSIVDTSRKRGLNEFDSLVGVIRGDWVFGGGE